MKTIGSNLSGSVSLKFFRASKEIRESQVETSSSLTKTSSSSVDQTHW